MSLSAGWFPDDTLDVPGESASGGKSVLSHLPENDQLISHVQVFTQHPAIFYFIFFNNEC